MPSNFEQMAQEAGLAKPMVRRRVPELADTVLAALQKIEITNPVSEKLSILIRMRCENVLKRFRG
jgi:hypothetical protein